MIDAALRMRILLLSGDDLVPLIRNRQPAAPTNRHKSVKIVELRPNPPWTLRAGPWDVDVHRGVEIGQIAALPYWSSGPPLDSPVSAGGVCPVPLGTEWPLAEQFWATVH